MSLPPVVLTITAAAGSPWQASDLTVLQALPNAMSAALSSDGLTLSVLADQHIARSVSVSMAQAFPGHPVVWAAQVQS